ncbi:MAG: DUF2029 domain-containing protein [Propionibacteriaceae bacterium]|jgi:hypothetical protein|nr:DUF2029 domain-containing protein [Propionibacteriaceae bacterium]
MPLLASHQLPRWIKALWFSLRLPTRGHALGWWFGTRIVLFAIWAIFDFNTQSDVVYYYRQIHELFNGTPPSEVLIEYPTPLLWLLSIPYLLGFGTHIGYMIAFITLFVAGDALMGYVLWRSARQYGTNPRPAVAYWIWFVVATGPIIYMRLDFLTAALSAAGLIAIVRAHRFASGAMIGMGAAIKLWPALLWPATMKDKRALRQASLGFFGVGSFLAVASLIYAGWERLVSPLDWQSDRGLQIESIFATPVMVARWFDSSTPQEWTVYISKYNAFEILGPWTITLTHIATIATIIGGLTMLVLYLGWLFRRDRTPIEAGTLMIVATLIMIITNKTFSPQYMIWLGGPVAALLTISDRHPSTLPNQGHLFSLISASGHLTREDHLLVPLSLARHIAIWTLILATLTQLVYPILYPHFVYKSWMTPVALVVLSLRNLGLVYFSIRLIYLSFRSIAFRPR